MKRNWAFRTKEPLINWIQLQFSTHAELAPSLESALEEAGAVSVTMTDAEDQPLYEPAPGETPLWNNIQVTGLFDSSCHPESIIMDIAGNLLPDSLPAYALETIEDEDWERAWMQDFKPIRCGERLWICPSWTAPPDSQAVNLMLDPGLAFGTGTHPTTALCLKRLDANPPAGATVIDYGCGSGILGIAALLLGAAKAIGVDTDPQALQATRDNCEKNQLAHSQFPVYLPENFNQYLESSRTTLKVDGILANILAQPLTQLVRSLADLVRTDGWVVLSGILEEQAEHIMTVYSPWFTLNEPEALSGWVCISGRRNKNKA